MNVGRALSSVEELFLHTGKGVAQRSAPEIGAFSRVSTPFPSIPPNKVSNTGRFRRVERCIHRHVRSGEFWFVGRRDGRVKWQRLLTYDLNVARTTVAMLGCNAPSCSGRRTTPRTRFLNPMPHGRPSPMPLFFDLSWQCRDYALEKVVGSPICFRYLSSSK